MVGFQAPSPATTAGGVAANLLFRHADMLYGASLSADQLNFAQVDGIVFFVDCAASPDGSSHGNLTNLTFTQAVAALALAAPMLPGAAMVCGVRRLRG